MTDERFRILLDFMLEVMGKVENGLEFKQQVLSKLEELKIQGEQTMALIDDVRVKVEAQTTVIGSAVTLLSQLHALLLAAGTDPTKLAALGDLISSNSKALADAVVANTPVPPAP